MIHSFDQLSDGTLRFLLRRAMQSGDDWRASRIADAILDRQLPGRWAK